MPGGYSGYLNSLRKICVRVDEYSVSTEELAEWISEEFSLGDTSARLGLTFLRKSGVMRSENGVLQLDDRIRRWMAHDGHESGALVAVIHSRVQYIGEMLAELDEPKSADELRKAAARYSLNWDTAAQVNIRRGWLESACLIELTEERTVAITTAGRDLLDQLELYEPTVVPLSDHDAEPPHASDRQRANTPSEILAAEISNASTDASNPERFERAVRDAFKFLGFAAELLGGPGKTDVLLLLGDEEAGEGSSKEEIQQLLDTLSSPLVGTVCGQREMGYLLASDPQVCSLRIQKLAGELAPD